ncbi:hypoxia-inducible factor prolyl 4-hydroxylase [Fistulifera solaris]|uniref:Hypoxia-inducible factor prolyl 4-hydroxylase n=1 Tax=Fistulifera solaris TaxID=1519565 RepID=A0A1Z5JHG0_FISSO|nr:hypoxia-inducible factor prolyl 4-hydroxylase [Fistulifera solaris]|eukprot:GAX13429.1 hypoxia-inducible factor prolyl 4-hydroxylase [Fistulifera solaris]
MKGSFFVLFLFVSNVFSQECNNLQRMEYNVGDGPQETFVYVEAWDRQNASSFLGRHVKFVNLLTVPVELYWEQEKKTSLVKVLRPLSTAGITAFVDHVFSFRLREVVLERFRVRADASNVFSIPLKVVDRMTHYYQLPERNTTQQEESYQWLTKTLLYNDYYYNATGRSFLSRYGRLPPRHFMWPADFLGQEHVVQNLTLTVLSCAPRVFEIRDFLSSTEVEHLWQFAQQKKLTQSQIGDENTDDYASKGTRSSYNSWIGRHESALVETIYRRAYNVLQLPHTPDVTEPLQVVRYRFREAYRVHADFGYPDPSHAEQPTRFATLLLYLNSVTMGGETSFPLGSHGDLRVRPEAGKAVLFYLQTPDGNMDEKSLHEALPVIKGEKWLANLWFWEPVKDVESLQ